MMEREKKLQYTFAMKPPYLLVGFIGVFNGATLSDAAECQGELLKAISEFKILYVALNFQEITKVDGAGIPAIQRIRRGVKDGGSRMLLCAVKPEIRNIFLDAGIFGMSDFSDSVETVLPRFTSGK